MHTRIRRLVFVTIATLTSIALAGDDVITTVVAPPGAQPVVAGAQTELLIIYMNASSVATKIEIPREMPAILSADSNRSIDVVLRRLDNVGDRREIAPGSFVSVRYALSVPVDVLGKISVAPDRSTGSAATLLVTTPSDVVTRAVVAQTMPATQPVPSFIEGEVHHTGFVEFFGLHFFPHEPMYFLVGAEDPAAKFQISFKYKVLNDDGSIAKAVPALGGLYIGYSQTSFWDLGKDSQPFFDNSYRPEVFFSYDNALPKNVKLPGVSRLGLQFGAEHESNGRGGSDSRSLNIAYIRPIFVFGNEDDLFLTFAPKVFVYLPDLDDNRDMKDYRGYAELRLVTGWGGGLQMAAVGRIGDDWDKGSLELDLSYPLRAASHGNFDLYLYGQFFTGYGESLLDYNKSDTTFRLGVALVR